MVQWFKSPSFPSFNFIRSPWSVYTLAEFRADWRSGTPRAGGDAAEAGWFTVAELGELDLWDETRRIIAMAIDS